VSRKKRRGFAIEQDDHQGEDKPFIPESERGEFRPSSDFERLMREKRRPYVDEFFYGKRFD
jgi:hypothetical protein